MRYAVAKYTPDLFRREPRNIGVFVASETRAAMRFAGERNGDLDLRLTPDLQEHGAIYAEWHAHWQRTVQRVNSARFFPSVFADRAIAAFLADGGDMFSVHTGGTYVPEEDEATCEDVARILYGRLVGASGVEDVDQAPDAPVVRTNLFRAVKSTFQQRGLIHQVRRGAPADEFTPLIKVNAPVSGSLPEPHRPSFSQLNGKLTVMEDVDFSAYGEDKVREHALATAFMFGDIRQANSAAYDVDLVAIVHYTTAATNEYAQKIGGAALRSVEGTRIVNWEDTFDRERFLNERMAAATLLH